MASRQSDRIQNRAKKERQQLEQLQLDHALDACRVGLDQYGFDVRYIDSEIGSGVFTKKEFLKGDFLLEYTGELLSFSEARKKLRTYDLSQGSFQFHFRHREKALCIDATEETYSQGRMVNDAPKGDPLENCKMNVVMVDCVPHLCLFAIRNIAAGEELRYDYGDYSLPWRKKAARLGKLTLIIFDDTPMLSSEKLKTFIKGTRRQSSTASESAIKSPGFQPHDHHTVSLEPELHKDSLLKDKELEELRAENARLLKLLEQRGSNPGLHKDQQHKERQLHVHKQADKNYVNENQQRKRKRLDAKQLTFSLDEGEQCSKAKQLKKQITLETSGTVSMEHEASLVSRTSRILRTRDTSKNDQATPSASAVGGDSNEEDELDDNVKDTAYQPEASLVSRTSRILRTRDTSKNDQATPSASADGGDSNEEDELDDNVQDTTYQPEASLVSRTSKILRTRDTSKNDQATPSASADGGDSNEEDELDDNVQDTTYQPEASLVSRTSRILRTRDTSKNDQATPSASADGGDSNEEDELDDNLQDTTYQPEVSLVSRTSRILRTRDTSKNDQATPSASADGGDSNEEDELDDNVQDTTYQPEASLVSRTSKILRTRDTSKNDQATPSASADGGDSNEEDELDDNVQDTTYQPEASLVSRTSRILRTRDTSKNDQATPSASADGGDSNEEDELDDNVQDTTYQPEASLVSRTSKILRTRDTSKNDQATPSASADGGDSNEEDELDDNLQDTTYQPEASLVSRTSRILRTRDTSKNDQTTPSASADGGDSNEEDELDDNVQDTTYQPGSDGESSEEDEDENDDGEIKHKNATTTEKATGSVEDENDEDIADSDFGTALRRQMRNVTVGVYRKKEDGTRDYSSKIDVCLYCNNAYKSRMSTHVENSHQEEEKVKEARLLPKGSKERKTILREIQNKGNFNHNAKVILAGVGELIVGRRPGEDSKREYGAHEFMPCEYCLGFFFQYSLWHHIKSCPSKPKEKQPAAMFLRDSRFLLSPFVKELSKEDELAEKLLNGMKETKANPGIPKVCKDDPLIVEFAKSLLGRLGEDDEQRLKDMDTIRTKVRTVGRLLKHLSEKHTSAKPLSDYICGPYFQSVVDAVKQLATESDSPQLALSLGIYVNQLALLKISCGVMTADMKAQEDGRNFQWLYQAHWNNKVSCVAKRRQRLRQLNKPVLVPLTTDLVTLKDFVMKHLQLAIKCDKESWKWVAQLLMVRILLFNKRRVSEVQELKVNDFLGRRTEENDNEEIMSSLDVSERLLAKRMCVIDVRGKSTRSIRRVFVLLTPDMVEGIEYLMRKRINSNPFIFGRSSMTPLDGCEAMRDVTKACPGLKYPARIRTTKLRKYLATTAQILDMNDSELKMLADHMGHNINIHTDVYRLQSSLIERAKVASVLIAMENGNISKFKGRRLQEITVEELPAPLSYDDSWETQDVDTAQPNDENTDINYPVPKVNAVTPEEEEDENSEFTQQPTIIDQETTAIPSAHTEDDLGQQKKPCAVAPMTTVPRSTENTLVKQSKSKKRWSDEENDIFMRHMKPFTEKQEMPPGQLIEAVYKDLNGSRSVAKIRVKIHNLIHGKQKPLEK